MTMTDDYKTEAIYIRLSIPLLARLLEYAREDSPSDIDLHWILERVINLNEANYTLTMAHYSKLVPDERVITVELPLKETT
jgi:hypothetical protein